MKRNAIIHGSILMIGRLFMSSLIINSYFQSSTFVSSSKTCETLKTKLTYKQENAPKDISAVLLVVVEKVNRELEGVLNVDVNWDGGDIHRVVGDHFVKATVTRLLSSVEALSESEADEVVTDATGQQTVTQCFSVPFTIEDTNECTLPLGNGMRHQCEEPSVCVNTIGSYECVCPFISSMPTSQKHNSQNDPTDPILNHDPMITPSESFWSQITSSHAIRTAWDLSLPLSTSYCPSLATTFQCCPSDAHTASGQECRSSFRCPSDPCSSSLQTSSKHQQQNSSPCAPSATCTRTASPLTYPAYACVCPSGTIGNGKKCRSGIDPIPQPKVTYDGVTPTSETIQNMNRYCSCTKPTIDPCAGFPACSHKNEVCVADKNNKPMCQCKNGYVLDNKYGCVDLTPPTLQLRCDPNSRGLNILKRGDVYEECAVDILDENAEEYARNLKISYSRPLSPGRCLTDLGTFTVNYTVATPWTDPPFAGVLRTVQVMDRNVCKIPQSEYRNWCPEILPKCDIENGAVCKAKPGGYRCECPTGMVGDGILVSEGGNGCVDRRPPVIEILGENPRIFKVCACGGLKGYLSDRSMFSQDLEERENKISGYEADIEAMIESTKGAELCATSSKSRNQCIKAYDETNRGVVDLSNRVKVGKPIRISPNANSNSMELIWKIPYDVSDDAGNEANTVFRTVKVIEMNLDELEKSLESDIMRNKAKEIEDAVNEAIVQERERRAMEDLRQNKKDKNISKCPSCPKCRKCNAANTPVSPEACQHICEDMKKESSNTCTPEPSSEIFDTIPIFIRDKYTSMVDTKLQDMLENILYCFFGFAAIICFVRIYFSGDEYSKIDREQELALLNAVSYHRSPPPNNRPFSQTYANNENTPQQNSEVLPPPRASISFTNTPDPKTTRANVFSPPYSNNKTSDDSIYQNLSPITPTRSETNGRRGTSNSSWK